MGSVGVELRVIKIKTEYDELPEGIVPSGRFIVVVVALLNRIPFVTELYVGLVTDTAFLAFPDLSLHVEIELPELGRVPLLKGSAASNQRDMPGNVGGLNPLFVILYTFAIGVVIDKFAIKGFL